MGDENTYSMSKQEYFTLGELTGDISAAANIPVGLYKFEIEVLEQRLRPNTNTFKTVTSSVSVIVQSVPRAAILQSVAVQILAFRRPALFVADIYTHFRQKLAGIFGVQEADILIFSVQRAPSKRVPLADVFGVEIQLAVRSSGSSFMDKMDVVKGIVERRAELAALSKLY